MLTSIGFNNYRCFSSHRLDIKKETIIVGRNNAGKSTLIEGFRIIGIITERFKALEFKNVPDWLDIPRAHRGVKVDLSGLSLSWENLFHRYQDPPALLQAEFLHDCSITVYLGSNGAMHAILKNRDGSVVSTKGQARNLDLPTLSVLPQVMPLQKEEDVLRPEYIRANVSSHLSSLHFRNQLNLFYDEYFDDFKSLVESSWPGMRIIELQGAGGNQGDRLSLLVQDRDFVAEVAWMGHGLQMWLQTMWFLTRTVRKSIIVLDEPDVYMHPDLQRRLLRYIRGRHSQCIIATHSTELLAETDPNNVLIVDRYKKKSVFTTSLPAVQKVIEGIGSAQNLQLTRLWTTKKLILVEGKDIKLLRRFQDLVFPESLEPIDVVPNMSIGGWSGWPYAVGSAMVMKNSVDEDIRIYCILDADYYTENQKKKRREEAVERGVNLHIWNRKEIENYLVVPAAIARMISKNIRLPLNRGPSTCEVKKQIDRITESLKGSTIDALAQELFNADKAKGVSHASAQARELVEHAWKTSTGRVSIVSGKNLLTELSKWSQEEFHVSFGVAAIAAEIGRLELDREVESVLVAIEEFGKFSF